MQRCRVLRQQAGETGTRRREGERAKRRRGARGRSSLRARGHRVSSAGFWTAREKQGARTGTPSHSLSSNAFLAFARFFFCAAGTPLAPSLPPASARVASSLRRRSWRRRSLRETRKKARRPARTRTMNETTVDAAMMADEERFASERVSLVFSAEGCERARARAGSAERGRGETRRWGRRGGCALRSRWTRCRPRGSWWMSTWPLLRA